MRSNRKSPKSKIVDLIGLIIALLLASLGPKPLLPAEFVTVGEDSVRGVVDGVFILLPDKEGWLVDELIANLDLPVRDQGTSVVNTLSLGGLVNLSLETTLEEVAWGEGKDIIELLLGLIEHTELRQTPQERSTLEDTLCIVLWKHEKVPGGLTDLGNSVMSAPKLPLVLQAEFTDDLELVVDALLLIRTHWLLEGTAEVVARHRKGQAKTANRQTSLKKEEMIVLQCVLTAMVRTRCFPLNHSVIL